MKEAKKYINHHRVQLSGVWYVPYDRAIDAVDIAVEETCMAFRKKINNEPQEKQV